MLLALFWAGQLAALIAGYWLSRRRRPGDRVLSLVVPWSAATAVSLVVVTAVGAPYSPWDVVRLAPTVGWLRGLPLYSGITDGPILSTMYTPLAAVAFAPAAILRDPAAAVVAARGLAFLYSIVPLYLICRAASAGDRLAAMAALWLAVLAALASPALRYSISFVHADAPALGCLGMTCWLMMAGRDSRPRGMMLASAFAWLAVWSKQTMVVVPVLVPLWVLFTRGRSAALGATASTLVTGALVGGVCVAIWGDESMFFGAVLWPGHLPWKGSSTTYLVDTAIELAWYALPMAIVLAASAREGEHERSGFCVLVAVAIVPLAIMGRAKKGGDVNSFCPVLYPLLLACAARVTAIVGAPRAVPAEGTAWKRLATASLVWLTLLGIPQFVKEAKLVARLRSADAEVAFLRAWPGHAYFPWHPLAHLVAEGRMTHHAHSVWERGVAGFAVDRPRVLSGIPTGCRYVCFPLKRLGPAVGFGWSFELLERHGLLEPGARPAHLAALPDYECYELRSPPQSDVRPANPNG
jgi:hypothetical protein